MDNYASFHTSLSRWYEQNKRVLPWRETTDPYRIWLSEIILQQTRVQQGMEYYMRFVGKWPTVEALAAADEDEVMLMWQGLGYYSRARNLHKAAKMVVEEGWTPFPDTFERVLSLPGVGEYTAGAIMSFAYNAPYPAADGNVYRVLSRLFDCDEAFDTTVGKKLFRDFAWQLLDRSNARLHNSAIMELGALFCTPQGMDCANCPVMSFCKAYAAGTAEMLPVRKARPKLRDRYLHYLVYQTPDGHTLLHQRTDKDIWQHLYEFPLIETPTADFAAPDGCRKIEFLHVLSHQRLHAVFYTLSVAELPQLDGCFSIQREQLQDYALSRLTLKYLDATS